MTVQPSSVTGRKAARSGMLIEHVVVPKLSTKIPYLPIYARRIMRAGCEHNEGGLAGQLRQRRRRLDRR